METIRNNLPFVILLTLLLAGFGGLIIYKSAKAPPSPRAATIEGVKEYEIKERDHVEGTVNYPTTPPAGGQHNAIWVGCDQQVYNQPLQNEKAVHSLEHGGVWITYRSDVDPDTIDKLSGKVKTSAATFMSPYPDQPSPITLSAWGVQLEVTSADDPRIDQFLVKYRKSGGVPEPGATCTAPDIGA